MPSGTPRAPSIKGKKILRSETNSTFILLLRTLLVMVVLYLLDIYNSGIVLFGIVAFGAYIYLPKVWNEYEYIFVVTINGVSKQFSCISKNSATVNTNFVIPTFRIINERVFQRGIFFIETQKIELTIAGDGFKGSFSFEDLSFSNKNINNLIIEHKFNGG